MIATKILSLFSLVLTASTIADDRIAGGAPARRGYFPHLVSLRTPQNLHYCGASILSNTWFITAGHCVSGRLPTPHNVHAWVGAHNRTDGVRHRVARIILHPRFNRRLIHFNLALLRSATPVAFVPGRVQAIRLPKSNFEDRERLPVWIAGWGLSRSSTGGSIAPPVLQLKSVLTIYRATCRLRLGREFRNIVQDISLCTLAASGGSCRGDAGGSVLFQGQLLAVKSWGGCVTGKPDIHTLVFPNLDFIRRTMQY